MCGAQSHPQPWSESLQKDVSRTSTKMPGFAEREDAYWKTQFSEQAYYAVGRSYGQYRPAYELGWNAALEDPESDFDAIVVKLERQWESRRSTSLLPWREVHVAVKQAWLHALEQLHSKQQVPHVALGNSELIHSLHFLYRACVLLVDDLGRLSAVPMSDFAQQVLERHIRLLQQIAQQLKILLGNGLDANHHNPLQQSLHSHWRRLQWRLKDWETAQVFEVCEVREKSLLEAFENLLRKPLPVDTKVLLAQHAKLLKNNMEKLSWVRHNWTL